MSASLYCRVPPEVRAGVSSPRRLVEADVLLACADSWAATEMAYSARPARG